MGELWAIAWGAIRLEDKAFRRWQGRSRNLAAGLALLLGVSLLAGLADAAAWTHRNLNHPPRWADHWRLIETVDSTLYRSPAPLDMQHEVIRNLAAWLDLKSQLAGLPQPLGRQASGLLQGLARAFSTPYRRLALWLPYSLLVFALARAFGGRATLPEMLGMTTLYVVPHLLDVFSVVPVAGRIVGLVTLWWGAVIYVKAVAVANSLDAGHALLAALLPALSALAVALIVLGIAIVAF